MSEHSFYLKARFFTWVYRMHLTVSIHSFIIMVLFRYHSNRMLAATISRLRLVLQAGPSIALANPQYQTAWIIPLEFLQAITIVIIVFISFIFIRSK